MPNSKKETVVETAIITMPVLLPNLSIQYADRIKFNIAIKRILLFVDNRHIGSKERPSER
ncbi:hypothetical protein D3C73_1535760 [compost metagenome]